MQPSTALESALSLLKQIAEQGYPETAPDIELRTSWANMQTNAAKELGHLSLAALKSNRDELFDERQTEAMEKLTAVLIADDAE